MNTYNRNRAVAGLMVPVLALGLMLPYGAYAQTPTNAQLLAQIQTLMQQVTALQQQLGGGESTTRPASVPVNYSFDRNLSVGMSGQDVLMLQRMLNADPATRVAASGAGSIGNETIHFGPRTQDAVSRFQVKYRSEILTPVGLTNPTGFVGPATRAKLNMLTRIATTVPTQPTTPPTPTAPTEPSAPSSLTLSGGEGSIDVDNRSLSTVEIALGASETVYEVEVEAVDSDIAINRVDFHFNARPWLYFDQVSLYADGDRIGRLTSQSDFTSVGGGNYRARFGNLQEIVREGDMVELTLELRTRDALAGSRIDDTITVRIPDRGIRMVDGAGLTGYAPEGAALSATAVSFDDTFGRADITVRAASSSPDQQILEASNTTRTTVSSILSFEITARDQVIIVEEVDVKIETGANNPNQVITRVRLYTGTTLLSTQTIPSGSGVQTVTFDRINRNIARNETMPFRILVELDQANRYTTPNSIEVVLNEIRGEAADGSMVKKSSLQVGSGIVHDILVEGVSSAQPSKSVTTQSNDRIGIFTFTFDLTAFGNTFYIDERGIESVLANITQGTATTTGINISSNARLTSNGNYRVNEGQTRQFTVEVVLSDATQNGFHRVTLEGIRYGTSDVTGTPNTGTLNLSSPDFRSPTLFLVQS